MVVELVTGSLDFHMQNATSVVGEKQQQDGWEKTEVVNREKIGLKLCRRNEHEAVINLRDFYL